MIRVLLVGANSALARASMPILAKDYELITAGRHNCDIDCDITKEIVIPSGIDAIVNFTAAFGGMSDEDIREAEDINALGLLCICSAAKRASVKHIINISSLSATHTKESPYYTIYAISKKHGDELAEFYCAQHGLALSILRPSQIFGDDGSFARHQPFFWGAVEKAAKGQDIVIYGKHDPLRNYIHAVDLAELLRRVIAERIVGAYSCQYPMDVTFSQIAQTAQRTFGRGGTITFLHDKPDIPDNVFPKDETLYEKTGYRPKISLEVGMQRIERRQEAI